MAEVALSVEIACPEKRFRAQVTHEHQPIIKRIKRSELPTVPSCRVCAMSNLACNPLVVAADAFLSLCLYLA